MLGVARKSPNNSFPSQVSWSHFLLFAFKNSDEYNDDDEVIMILMADIF